MMINQPIRRQDSVELTNEETEVDRQSIRDDGPWPIRSKFADMRFVCWDPQHSANQRPVLHGVDQSENRENIRHRHEISPMGPDTD